MLFDGKSEAIKLEATLTRAEKDKKLGIILIGSDAASTKYVKLKTKFCQKIGVPYEICNIDENSEDLEILSRANEFINKKDIYSVIIQLSLPRKSLYAALNLIPLHKDIDILSHDARKKSFRAKLQWESPIIQAFEHFVKVAAIELTKAKTAVVGGGFLIGQPLLNYLERHHFPAEGFDIGFDKTRLSEFDLVVLGTGEKDLVDGTDLPAGACAIDFGFPGDLNMQSELSHLKLVAPSVGGLGPLVIRYLIKNHLLDRRMNEK